MSSALVVRCISRENYPVHGGMVNSEIVANYWIHGMNGFVEVFVREFNSPDEVNPTGWIRREREGS